MGHATKRRKLPVRRGQSIASEMKIEFMSPSIPRPTDWRSMYTVVEDPDATFSVLDSQTRELVINVGMGKYVTV